MKTRTQRSVEHSIRPARRLAEWMLAYPGLALWMLAAPGFSAPGSAAPGFAGPAMACQATDTPAVQDPGNKQDQPGETAQDDVLEIEWRTDIVAAKVEATKAGKPILYYFRCDP